MFRNKRLPFAAATKIDKILDKIRSRYLVFATFVTVLLLGVASPAHAAGPSIVKAAAAPNIMCYIGAPSLEVFDPAQDATQKITSIILGLVIVGSFAGVIIGGIRIAMAGKRTEQSADGVKTVSNALVGATVVFGGILLFSIIIAVLVSIVPFGC